MYKIFADICGSLKMNPLRERKQKKKPNHDRYEYTFYTNINEKKYNKHLITLIEIQNNEYNIHRSSHYYFLK